MPANYFDDRGTEALKMLKEIFDEKTILRYLELWDKKELEKGLKPVTDANKVFDFLKRRDVKTGILTNRFTRPGVINTFRASGVDFSKLDFFVTHDPNPTTTLVEKIHHNHFLNRHPKPDARAIAPALPILKNLPEFPKSVYYIGDNLIDLEFARANGFGFVGVLSGVIKDKNEWRAAGSDIIIKDISEIPKFLQA